MNREDTCWARARRTFWLSSIRAATTPEALTAVLTHLARLHGYVLPADPLDLAVEIAGRDDRLSVLLSLGAGRLYQMRYKGGRAHDSPSRRNHARV